MTITQMTNLNKLQQCGKICTEKRELPFTFTFSTIAQIFFRNMTRSSTTLGILPRTNASVRPVAHENRVSPRRTAFIPGPPV